MTEEEKAAKFQKIQELGFKGSIEDFERQYGKIENFTYSKATVSNYTTMQFDRIIK